MAKRTKVTQTTAPTQPTTPTKESKITMATSLDLDAVNAILANSRSKGGYDEDLLDFLKSGDIGREIPLGEKKAQSMKASFVSAKARQSKLGEHFEDAQKVEIRIVDNKLYLLRPDLAAAAAEA